jgi:tetratricopeptide (TPR) repeat protein
MRRQLTQSKELLSKVEHFREELTDLLNYYYHFFQGMYHWRSGNYREALEQYWYAEELLEKIPDQIEKAEFHYRVAVVYYDMGKNMLSIQHARKAQELYNQDANYGMKNADCENLLGLNCIDLKQYEEAEQHLIYALDVAQKHEENELIQLVRYNLGFLYSEQRLSEVAIRHLMDVYDSDAERYKTLFLLAKEYYRLGEYEKANKFVAEGLEECERANDRFTAHRLNILKTLYLSDETENIEAVVKAGIKYFQEKELWYLVQEYAEALARKLYDFGLYEKASHYFHLSCEAKDKIFEKEALT